MWYAVVAKGVWLQFTAITFSLFSKGMYVMFHYLKGVPFETMDQNSNRFKTSWEQIDNGEQFTATRKFLIMVPIVL